MDNYNEEFEAIIGGEEFGDSTTERLSPVECLSLMQNTISMLWYLNEAMLDSIAIEDYEVSTEVINALTEIDNKTKVILEILCEDEEDIYYDDDDDEY